MNQESDECKVEYIEYCNLPIFTRSVKDNCGAEPATSIMTKIMAILRDAAVNRHGNCKVTQPAIACSLVILNPADKIYKPLAFIKKMRNVAQRVLSKCNNTLRLETGRLFKEMWSELKCQRNQKFQMGQRSLGFELISENADLDDDDFLEKNKTLCSFDGYAKRNEKLFDDRNGMSQNPDMTKGLASQYFFIFKSFTILERISLSKNV